MSAQRFAITMACGIVALSACGGSTPAASPSGLPPQAAGVRVRFADGAPELETIVNGVPQSIGQAYLQVNGQTVASSLQYGSLTPFVPLSAGTLSLQALNVQGYRVGPLKSARLTGGKNYTLIVVGSFPNYRVLTFEEPPALQQSGQLSLYEASPEVPKADFGSFAASSKSDFKRLGSAALGTVATVSLGGRISNLGGYAGKGAQPLSGATLTPAAIDSFDRHNVLPFRNASRLSLFLFDRNGSSAGPLFGSLDR